MKFLHLTSQHDEAIYVKADDIVMIGSQVIGVKYYTLLKFSCGNVIYVKEPIELITEAMNAIIVDPFDYK